MSETHFVPRWASPPGDTIREIMSTRDVGEADLLDGLGLRPHDLGDFLEGNTPMTINLADRLTGLVGGSVEFWMTRDGQYRTDLRRVAADRWASALPVAEMARHGWIASPGRDWEDRIEACLEFFGVEDVYAWEEAQSALLARARFRSSASVESDDNAVAVWLRQTEVELTKIECASFDRAEFGKLLPRLRRLTLESDPSAFLPLLAAECAAVGVAVGVVKPPTRCAVSGVARRLENGNPSIALTGRYRSDDHLWFSFFHEAAHLVLHDEDAIFLDEIEPGQPEPSQDSQEAEADRYAGELLVPPQFEAAVFDARRDPLELRKLSKRLGVSIGVLIGHLQHRGALGYGSRLNKLKRRYRWNGVSLEKA